MISKNINDVKVSVCCMTYNHADTIAQTLDSILMQKTSFPVKIVVHDDASTDDTQKIVREYEQRYPDRIYTIFQNINQYCKCNIAYKYINPILDCNYLAICEGDDYWIDENKLQVQVEFLVAHPDYTMCFHAIRQIMEDGKIINFYPLKKSQDVDADTIIKKGGLFCPSASLVLRRDIIDKWPKYRLMARIYDYPLQILAATEGKVHYFNDVMAAYRFEWHGSWTRRQKQNIDWSHLKNEIRWLDEFNCQSGYRYDKAINEHLARYCLNLYMQFYQADTGKIARKMISRVKFPECLKYRAIYLTLTIFGRRAVKIGKRLKILVKYSKV